ncbi:Ig-like domain-containing protein, partial [Pedobacter sp. Hv1]|uniref:Ig-like domain-containing protein n=1 Tax=Pedobacter sp. Hv1 TaxID=1740090 RepID=UPI000AE90470
TATDTDTQNSVADLQITNTDGKIQYIPGTTNTYTIVASNVGPSDVTGARVTNTLPAGVTGTWTAVYSGAATGTANGTGSISELVNMPSGTTVTYTYVVSVPSSYTGNFVNTATIAAPVGVTDPTPANNTATDTDTQNSTADLKITNTDNKVPYVPGTTNTYTMVVTNDGPSDVIGATVANTLPAGVTGTWTVVYTGGGTGNANGSNSIAETVNLPSGATATYTFVVNVPSSYTGNFVNTGTVTAPAYVTDPTPANNTATDTDTQNSIADLRITNTDGKLQYVPGTTNTYTVVVDNVGPSDAVGATVVNALPVGISTSSWTAVYTGGATGTANGTGGINETVNIPIGGKITYTVVMTIPSGRTGDMISIATVATPVGITDPTPANNSATDTDTQNSISDLRVTKIVDNMTPDAGSTVNFKITVVNDGPSDATGVKVTDLLKAGYTFVSATPSVGTYNNLTGLWTIGNLIYNQSVELAIRAKVVPDALAANYVNTATVTGDQPDPTPANNTSTITPVPRQVVDLAITKIVDNQTPDAGSEVTFTLKVVNNGPSRASNVMMNDLLKAGYTFVNANPSRGVYNVATGIWQLGFLEANEEVTIAIKVKVNPDLAATEYVNTAVVFGDQFEHVTGNNTATVTPVPVPVADLQITKTASSNTPSINTNVVFTLTATNKGPSNATGVSVKDLLKAGYTFVSATASTGTYNNTTGTWTIGNLASGASVTLKVTALVKATGPYDNTATVTGTEKDPIPGNNTVTITPVPQATPVAVNDEVKLCGGGSATVIDILANDLKSIADLDPSSVVITKQPSNGRITVDPVTGKVTYTPNNGYIGNDDFSYTVKDKNGGTSNVANVKIAINQPIIAVNDNATTNPNTAVTLDILANDIKGSADIVPSSVIITQQPSNGTLAIDPVTGKVTYTPNVGFFGTDSFKYTVKDANGCVSNVATVEIKLNDLPKIGLAKSVMAVQKQQNGSYNITYHFVVGNYGTAVLNNVSIKDDLRQTFKGDVFSVKSITSLGALKINPQYNGSSNTEMLLAGNTLAVGEVQHIEMVVNITLSNNKGTYNNSATAEGTSPSGLKSTDISTDGLKPDPTIPGDVTPSIPTPVDLTKPGEFIPEGFSPNQDGTNDTFVIRNTGNKRISLEIFNRWANRVYRSTDYKNDWAGQSNEGVRVGNDLPEGTYFYIIIIDGKDKYVGSITLKR